MATPATAAVVGVCNITIGEPHPSTHVNGTINSYGRIMCTVAMPNTHVRATLEKSNGTTWVGPTQDFLNVPAYKTYTSTSAIPCVGNAGTYRTQVAIAFHSPLGYNPSYHAKTYYSIWRSVACGLAKAAPGTTGIVNESPESVATITFLSDGTLRESTPEEIRTAEFVK